MNIGDKLTKQTLIFVSDKSVLLHIIEKLFNISYSAEANKWSAIDTLTNHDMLR